MTNHDQLRDALWALHDGQLGAEARTEVLAHLNGCAECRQALQRWEQIAGALFRIPDRPRPEETEAFVRQVMERLSPKDQAASSEEPSWVGNRWMIPALSFGVAALFLSIILPGAESIAPPDTLVLMDARDRDIGQWVLSPDPLNADNMLALAGDEK